jgi:hypothetical protein
MNLPTDWILKELSRSEKSSTILQNRASPLLLQVTFWMKLKKYAAM